MVCYAKRIVLSSLTISMTTMHACWYRTALLAKEIHTKLQQRLSGSSQALHARFQADHIESYQKQDGNISSASTVAALSF